MRDHHAYQFVAHLRAVTLLVRAGERACYRARMRLSWESCAIGFALVSTLHACGGVTSFSPATGGTAGGPDSGSPTGGSYSAAGGSAGAMARGTAGVAGRGTAGVAGIPSSGSGGVSAAGTTGIGVGGVVGRAGTGAAGTGTAGTSTGGTGPIHLLPACTTEMKGGACETEGAACKKTCGPQSTGFKSETCIDGLILENNACEFDCSNTSVDWSCYSLAAASLCSTTVLPMINQPCSVAACMPCSGGYLDSSGTYKTGACVCAVGVTGGKWSCASLTAWPTCVP
ncbi:MAG TPA: hypothetical protein VGI10_15710 [Polyangiaceae bacterium]